MKFATDDQAYLEKRKALSDKYGPRDLWSVIDHWGLYCGIGNLSRAVAVQDLLRGVLGVPGHLAEFGSWRGANLLYLAKLLRIFDPLGQKQVHCFESFEGLQTFTSADAAAERTRGKYKGSYEELLDLIDLYELQDEVVIHKGIIQDTLPLAIETSPSLSFSMVYCDIDLYEPTALALGLLHPRLSSGGVFVLDEWNNDQFPGETLAVREFLKRHGSEYAVEHVAGTRQPSLVLRKRGG